jgi:1,4-alpha-glucan branching enzyme
MLTKRKMGRGKVRVTFAMPPLEGVTALHLVGDFNNWSVSEHPLQQDKDGGWSVSLTLDAGRDYQFRYFANGAEWHNDWAADRYVPNEFGTDNSLVSTKDDALPAPKAAAKKAAAKKKST